VAASGSQAVALHRVSAPTSQHQALVEIREAIVAGRLQPGQRLIEADLAEQLGLSRGPIRDALRELGREGLVTIRPNRGAIVNLVQAEDVIEVYALRASLAMMALRNLIGTNRVSPQLVARLQSLAASAREGVSHQGALVAADLEFQGTIVDASGLPRVAARFRELTAEVRLFIQALRIRYDDIDVILAEHDQLIDALRDGDLGRAESIWHGRFSRAMHEFIQLIPDGERIVARRPWLAQVVD
jgi:DNA-binding GntR family transcriptional regulator